MALQTTCFQDALREQCSELDVLMPGGLPLASITFNKVVMRERHCSAKGAMIAKREHYIRKRQVVQDQAESQVEQIDNQISRVDQWLEGNRAGAESETIGSDAGEEDEPLIQAI